MKQPMKQNRRHSLFTFICITTLFLCTILVPQKAMAQKVTFQVTIDGVVEEFSTQGPKVSIDGNTISPKSLPSVKINKIWMVSLEEVFVNGLGCTYSFNAKTGKIILTNPNTGDVIKLALGSTEAITDDEEEIYTLSNPVLEAKDTQGNLLGILVPASELAEIIGYDCSYKKASNELVIKTVVFFDKDVIVPKYDTSIYSNVLTTVVLSQNISTKREEFQLITTNILSKENIVVTEDEQNGMISYTLLNTYNAIGYFHQKDFSTSFVKEVTVASEANNTIVTVKYNNQYSYMSLLEEEGVIATFSSATYSMRIGIPEGITFDQIKDVDQYHKKKFYFEVPGDWTEYYENNPVLATHKMITSLETKLSAAGNTRIVVKTKKLQGYKLTEKNGYFTVQIDDPRKIYENIVVLDAGHGGHDDGASNKGTKEKDLNYKIIYKKAKKYFNSRESNVKAYWTRTTDTFITLSDRAKFASKVGADLFVSLHMNSAFSSSANGMEIYYSKENNKSTNSGLTSKKLAKKMLKTLKKDLKESKTRGVKTARFYVTYRNTVPAILIELGFLSGSSDYSKLTSESYQNQAAESIYKCISEVFEQYPTDRAS